MVVTDDNKTQKKTPDEEDDEDEEMEVSTQLVSSCHLIKNIVLLFYIGCSRNI